jgi:hypothetical protein
VSLAIILLVVLSLAVFLAYASYGPTRSSTANTQGVKNLLINGGFDNGVCVQPQSVNASTLRCTSGWLASTNYGTVPAGTLAQVINSSGHSGGRVLEFKIERIPGNLGVYAAQWLNQSGCVAGPGQTFGLKVQNGLWFSVWFRGTNLSGVGLGATVTFHNGSSKLSIAYHLEPSAKSGYEAHGLPLSTPHDEASVDVYLSSASSSWKQLSFDLYEEFVKYFRVDPILNHYCVNYVALSLGQLTSGSPSVNAPGSYAYGYFDDVELYVKE